MTARRSAPPRPRRNLPPRRTAQPVARPRIAPPRPAPPRRNARPAVQLDPNAATQRQVAARSQHVPAAAPSQLEVTDTKLTVGPIAPLAPAAPTAPVAAAPKADVRRSQRAADARRRGAAAARRLSSMAQMTEIHPGDVIADRYRVSAVLGRNRGLLLDAAHTSFEQRVVIRVISPALADAKAVDRFQRESRILSKLETEHVARIIDVGTLPNGSLFLAREYLDGVSLAEHARSNKMGVGATVDLVLQICEAVQEAHSRGVVLRDLQPSHVFLTHKRNGEPVAKLTDFGTCKVMRQGDTDEQSCTKLLGLSSSAAPELVRQRSQIDERADVWSLGCLLYELLTGVPAFQGDGAMLMLSIANEQPVPPSSLRRDIDIPPSIDETIMQALSKSRSRRFQTVYQFASSLRQFASPRGQLLITQIARLAGEEPTAPSVEPYSDSIVAESSSDEHGMTFSRSVRASESSPAFAAGAPFPLASPSVPSLSASPSQIASAPAVASTPSAPVVPSIPVVNVRASSTPSMPVAQYGVYASLPAAHSSYPPVVATAAEETTDIPLHMMQPRATFGRSMMVAGAAAMTPIAIVLFIFALATSSPDAEVAHAGWELPSTSQVVSQVEPTIVADASDLEEAQSGDTDAAAASKTTAKAEPVASAVNAAPTRASGPASSQFLDTTEESEAKPTKKAKSTKSARKADKAANKSESTDKPKSKGTIVAMAVGASCNFAIDGASRGSGSSVRLQVSAGRHTVSCRSVGGSNRSKSVLVKPGKAAVAVFKF